MKEIFELWRGWQNGRLGRMAAFVCLMAVLGWTGAAAQGFTADHGAAGASLTGWRQEGVQGWSITGGYAAPNAGAGPKFLINNYQCAKDGIYTVGLNRADNRFNANGAGVVFRYRGTNPNRFYYVTLEVDPWGSTPKIKFLKNRIITSTTDADYDGVIPLSSGTVPGADPNYTIKIKVIGSVFEIFDGGDRRLGQFSDTDIDSGAVGYVVSDGWNVYGRFASSAWKDTNTVRMIPAGWLAWNTVRGNNVTPGTGGLWSGNFWSQGFTDDLRAWISGSKALFSGPDGVGYTITIPSGATSVDSMRFESNGYRISLPAGGAAGTLNMSNGQIVVATGKSAVITAVLGGSSGLTFSGGGTLTLGEAGGTANTYTGATTVSAGTLIAGKSGALGEGAATVTATGARLQVQAGANLSNTSLTIGNQHLSSVGSGTGGGLTGGLVLGGTGEHVIDIGSQFTIGGTISGTNNLKKTGAAPLVLTGSSTYSGDIAVDAGSLRIEGAAGALGGGRIILDGTSVTFNRTGSGEYTHTGRITGTGNLIKEGAGTLKLVPASAYTSSVAVYSGTTTISAGKISIASEANIGSGTITVAKNGTLELDVASEVSFGRAISADSGTFSKAGTGTLNLGRTAAGDMNVRKIDVAAGALNVAGFPAGSRVNVADTVIVRSGGRLAAAVMVNGRNIIVSGGGVLAGSSYGGAVRVEGTGTVENKNATGTITVQGSLNMGNNSVIDLALSSAAKVGPTGSATPRIDVVTFQTLTGGLTFGTGVKLNITSAITDADTGTYLIARAASVTGSILPANVKVADGYEVEFPTAPTGQVRLRIFKPGNSDIVNTALLKVESVTVTSVTETASTVKLVISGFSALVPHTVAGSNPRVDSAYVWYKPGGPVNGMATDAAGSMRLTFTAADGDTKEITLTVNNADDALYYFTAGVIWTKDGAKVYKMSTKEAYLLDPMKLIKNGLIISLNGSPKSEETRVEFDLSITGYAALPLFATGVDYKPYVDSVAVWLVRNALPPADFAGNNIATAVPGGVVARVFSLAELKQGTSFQFTFETGPVAEEKDDFYFVIAPRWTGTAVKVGTTAKVAINELGRPPFVTEKITVRNHKTPQPNNPCVLTAVQPDKRAPAVTVTVGTTGPFDEHAAGGRVRVDLSFDPSMADIFHTEPLVMARLEAGDVSFNVTADGFVGEVRSVYYVITVIGLQDGENKKSGSFTVGREPPAPLAGLTAEPVGKGMMVLRWDPVTVVANNVGSVETALVHIAHSTNLLTASADVKGMSPVTVPASKGEHTIMGLEPETDYSFAAVLEDVVNASKASWNLVSAPALVRENTGPFDVLANVMKVDSAYFIDSTMNFRIIYSHQVDDLENKFNFRCVVALGGSGSESIIDSLVTPRTFFSGMKDSLLTRSLLGSELMFDTVYRVSVFTVDKEGNSAAGSSIFNVRVGAFRAQTVYVPPQGATAFVNNGKFGVTTGIGGGWSVISVPNCTTLVTLSSEGNVSGFDTVSVGYRYSVGVGGYAAILPPFTISIEAGEMSSFSVDDVKIYRWSVKDGFWEVLYDTKYADGYFTATAGDEDNNGVGSTYRLMVRTQPPVVRLPNGALVEGGVVRNSPVNALRAIEDKFFIESDVGNFRAKMVCAPADNSPLVNAEGVFDAKGTNRQFTFTIKPETIENSVDYGVLAYLIVEDGRYADTINVSRRVSAPAYSGFKIAPEPRMWLPFAAQVELEKKSIKSALKVYFDDEDEFTTYDTLFRLFRYYEPSDGSKGGDRWVEYKHESNEKDFDMEPGRLMWIKAATPKPIDFGAATSVSLTDPFQEIKLPAGQWTDFVLPFGFDMCVGDILAATQGAHLQFYRWKLSDKGRYVTDGVALMEIDSSLVIKGGTEPFTIYNPLENGAVTLVIPPRPAFMSRYRAKAGMSKQLAGGANSGGVWYYTIKSGTAGAPELNSVMVGYNADKRKFAVPPSFSNESVVLIDEHGQDLGHYFGPDMAKGGGTYRLRFYNDERRKTTFTFSAAPSAFVPGDMRVTFVNAATGEELGGAGADMKVAVGAMSHQDVLMVVGSREQQAKLGVGVPEAKFRVGAVMVNRAARSVRIKYYIPLAGIDRVEVSVYNIKGRMLWKNSQRVKPAMWNTTEWNSRESRHGAAASGLYIIRVKAIDARGKTVGVENRRITFAR